ncbi:hypothetical protein GTP41_18015 [Pseudoduganella sp. DS3]|uniref:Uncharacterized protein n=1 Tax=Pseudoduganella guangdongensis TaxID=2692179 RepID=A0A6N9HM86_9BURK|nr:hypothetical protein [Pseudoduganella guangdongensis]MYN03992.1 hypothetical protein [Pseudoduganella guangdongensis]
MSLVDIQSATAEDQVMDPALKQYVDSSLAVSEARHDAKLAEFRAIMEAYTARADEREAAAREREAAARDREELRARDVERRMAAFEQAVTSVKRAVVATGIAATLSTVFGVAAFNAALLQNMQSAFGQGRQASPAQVEILLKLNQIEHLLAEKRTTPTR